MSPVPPQLHHMRFPLPTLAANSGAPLSTRTPPQPASLSSLQPSHLDPTSDLIPNQTKQLSNYQTFRNGDRQERRQLHVRERSGWRCHRFQRGQQERCQGQRRVSQLPCQRRQGCRW